MKTNGHEPQPPRKTRATPACRLGQWVQAVLLASGTALVVFQLLRKGAALVFRYGGF